MFEERCKTFLRNVVEPRFSKNLRVLVLQPKMLVTLGTLGTLVMCLCNFKPNQLYICSVFLCNILCILLCNGLNLSSSCQYVLEQQKWQHRELFFSYIFLSILQWVKRSNYFSFGSVLFISQQKVDLRDKADGLITLDLVALYIDLL